MTTEKKRPKTMAQIMRDPRYYKGKHVIVVAGKVFTARTGERASDILDMVGQKYPGETPAITYIPKEDTLIL